MGLLNDLLNLNIDQRITYDPARNILFLNLEGFHARTKRDIDELRTALVTACQKVGKRVNSVVNHDGAHINETLYDDYAEMIEYMSQHYYLTTTRYSTSAFARMKMKEAMAKRGLQPHVFERREAAETFLQVVAEGEKTPV
jgi:propionate CoA-transferase